MNNSVQAFRGTRQHLAGVKRCSLGALLVALLSSCAGGPEGEYRGTCVNSLGDNPFSSTPATFDTDIMIRKLEKNEFSVKIGDGPATMVTKSGNMLSGPSGLFQLQVEFDEKYKALELNVSVFSCKAERKSGR